MKAAVRWLNELLDPGGLTPDAVEDALTHAGFPIDAREELPDGDARLEVEVTSNRGDCLSHVGLAREIAACTGRALRLPEPPVLRATGPAVAGSLRLENRVPDACPRFTAQVIRGARIAPSPAWLARRLESVGQRPINNAVDVTNYLTFLFGQPAHVFDLSRLAGRSLIVRRANPGEALTTLDGKRRALAPDDVVVADAERAQSLAGVIGGADSEVTAATTDLVLEAATWDPVAVRRTARRHQVRTDASHRFERLVDPRTLDIPARLASALLADLTGGTPCAGMLDEGRPTAPARVVSMRTERCRAVLGAPVSDAEMARLLAALGVAVAPAGGTLRCTIPAWRPDLEREIDLIEEVARTHGLRRIPIRESITVRVRAPQASEAARREIGRVLSGMGFFETVTITFTTPALAAPWLAPGETVIEVEDDRRAHEPALRPSVLVGLLACRRVNQDARAAPPGTVRLFETASAFAARAGSPPRERATLAMLIDVPTSGRAPTFDDRQRGVRLMRGAVEAVVRAVAGARAGVAVEPVEPGAPAWERGGSARVSLGGTPIGLFGLIDGAAARAHGLDIPLAGAELDLPALLDARPPRAPAATLPRFPGIERDLSLLVDDAVPWDRVRTTVEGAGIDRLEAVAFVGSYRGKQTGVGRKSVTLRLRFRDPSRTLRHEEVDPQVESIVALARARLGAELRLA